MPQPFSVLLPVALPSSGPELFRLAQALTPPGHTLNIVALNLREEDNLPITSLQATYEAINPLEPLLETAASQNVPVDPISFSSRFIGRDISAVARDRRVDLILMGWYDPISNVDVETSVMHTVIKEAEVDVGVYLCRQFKPWKRVLVPFYGGVHDLRALELASAVAKRGETVTTILHVVKPNRNEEEPRLGLSQTREVLGYGTEQLKIVESDSPIDEAVAEARTGYDLVIIGASEDWGLEFRFFDSHHERLARDCPASLLVVRKYDDKKGRSITNAVGQEATLQ